MPRFPPVLLEFWTLAAVMAPYLLLGFATSAALHRWLSPTMVRRWLGAPGWRSTFKATLVGVPLPLCSCGVIPVATGLYRQGAGRGATTAFLASTPQTGVDSIAATWGMMGPMFALYRVVAAFVSGWVAGGLVDALVGNPRPSESVSPERLEAGVDRRTWGESLRFGFVTLPRDLAGSLLSGLALAALLGALLPPDFLQHFLGNTFLQYLAVTAVAMPLYVCSTGSIPLAYALMQAGASPGAALVFLIAGPATNAATMTAIAHVLGRRTLGLYLAAIVGVAWAMGWGFDQLRPESPVEGHAHAHGAIALAWWQHVTGLVLLALLLGGLWPRLLAWAQAPGPRRIAPGNDSRGKR